MQDREFLVSYLEQYFEELSAEEFYRQIFPAGELANHTERQQKGRYNAIAVELLPQGDPKGNARRYLLTDELDYLPELLKKDNFIIVSPISYAGRSRSAQNARYIYAMAIDLDGVTTVQKITDLFFQIENDVIPQPSYVVWSGSGLHLYYKFEQPIPCYANITKQMSKLKQALTRKIWNKYITDLYEKPQLQSLFQGFRLCGGVTKGGNRTRAFEVGKAVTIEYLNSFVGEKEQVTEFKYKSKLTKQEAASRYPEWYERRIVQGQPRGTWQCKKDLYEWWLNRLQSEITTGHRYYGIMCLSVYAKKCGVPKEDLEADAYGLIERMEALTTEQNNHFTREDVLAALEMYNDSYITFPIDTITQLTALPIEKNKRNGLPQDIHLQTARARKAILKQHNLMRTEGRPEKRLIVQNWQQKNPEGTKAQCIKETGLSKNTVYKFWG